MNSEILSNLVIKKLFSVSEIYTNKNAHAKRTKRPFWAVVIKYEGETIYTCHGKKYVSNIDNIAILPRGCDYEWVCTSPGHFCILEFESNIEYDEIISFPVKNGEKYLRLMRELEYKLTLKKPMYKLDCMKDAYNILFSLVQSAGNEYSPSYKRDKLSPAIDYIAKNYRCDISNDALAKMCDMSTVYFRKLFSEVMGIPPITYLHNLRIKKAKEMLLSDYSSIGDIALALGYSSIYDFSRAFKKQVGVPPSKYKVTK